MKKAVVFLLSLLLALSGCGETATTPFRVIDTVGVRRYCLLYRLDDRIIPQVDAAMNALALRGTLSAVSLRWMGRDVITLKGTRGAAAEAPPAEDPEPEPEETQRRRLIVGVERDFPPMAYEENGVLRGMSVEIAEALGEELGWEVALQPIGPEEVGTQLASGNIDCALGFDPASVREGRYSIGPGYMESDVVVAVRSASPLRRLRDIGGARIGTVNDPVIAAVLKNSEKVTRYASGATVYLSLQRCLNALDNGWCAAVAMDRLMLQRLQ